MMEWAAGIISVLIVVIALLVLYIHSLRTSAWEIEQGLVEKLEGNTNTLVSISSRDKAMRSLAHTINGQLRILREQRHRYEQGDQELKQAVIQISHDLRTPLTAICGYLELLEREALPDAVQKDLGIIQNRAEMMCLLTEELFRYSRIIQEDNAENRLPVSVNAILEESIAAFYADFLQRGIEPVVQMPASPVIRNLDSFALSRVFSNVLGNAVKYSGGDLEIIMTESGTITFTNMAPGLDALHVGRLFDRFYTVEDARKSTGLGLSIARTLMEQMQGSITASYAQDRLCFCVSLPDGSCGS